MTFSKLKALLRKAATGAVDELWSVLADCPPSSQPRNTGTISSQPGMIPQ